MKDINSSITALKEIRQTIAHAFVRCTDNCQEEDGTIAVDRENVTNNSREEDDTDDLCNKKYESTLFHGTQEIQISEGGEADVHKDFDSCKKNPGHTQFVPVNDFNKNYLPKCQSDVKLCKCIKAAADLTVRVAVKMTSRKRPGCWPNTNHPYPFCEKKEGDVTRLGTGMVWHVHKWTEEDLKKYNKGTCLCQKCKHSDKPSKVWGFVCMYTATHVVFDDIEAKNTTCRLFYDKQNSPLVTLNDWTVVEANIEVDRCWLKCVTCDVDLLDKLYKMVDHWCDLWKKVNYKYMISRDKDKLIFIVSHPHGCPKQVSVGQWINRYKVSDDKTRYTYTTCTCPGSSGARVHTLGYYHDWLYYDCHIHSGVNSEGFNFSTTGRDCL